MRAAGGIPWRRALLLMGLAGLLAAGGAAGYAALLLDALKASPPYAEAVALARADPRVAGILGAPVEPDWYVLGSVRDGDGAGRAEMTIPLVGSRRLGGTARTGRLHVVADRAADGGWVLRRVDLVTLSGPAAHEILPLIP